MNKAASKLAIMTCEAWADRGLYCWHWFAGRPGTSNDINVVFRSPLFREIMDGSFKFRSRLPYKVTPKGKLRTLLYLLADGIYPNWPVFAKPMHRAESAGEKRYSQRQETVRKDVERLFGVLQSRFEILRREFRYWDRDFIVQVTNVCVILHNLIVRMQQKGDFTDEAAGTDIVTELYDMERMATLQSRTELEHNLTQQEGGDVDGGEDEADGVLASQLDYTDVADFISLRSELIDVN